MIIQHVEETWVRFRSGPTCGGFPSLLQAKFITFPVPL